MRATFLFLIFLLHGIIVPAQDMRLIADSIRINAGIPELSYAVVSADSIYALQALGWKKVNTTRAASLSDRFRIGSNTKAITCFIAAELVAQGKISWDTKFFDLFPELRQGSRKEYRELTLMQLLSFRTKLYAYTYTYDKPVKGQFAGNDSMQRYEFAQWFFTQPPVPAKDTICFSNLGYVAAGLMMERASGKSYQQLVAALGKQTGIAFGFGQPNATDSLQVWGHDSALHPEPPTDGYKLNWLLAAGNINVSLPDYLKFIQLQLKGLQGGSTILTQDEFKLLHYGLKDFALGWFWGTDDKGVRYSYNTGNPGTFLSKVFVCPEKNRAYIILANVQSDEAEDGMDALLENLRGRYE